MRALLDENVPEELGVVFEVLHATHIEALGFKGISNGELLQLARADFQILISFDKGLPHQQSHTGERLSILVLRLPDNKKDTVLRHAKGIEAKALSLGEGELGEFWP